MTQGAELHAAIEKAVQDRGSRDALRARRAAALAHLEQRTREVAERCKALDDETADVEALESLSWTRLWAAMAGTRDSDLMREKAEQQAARYAVAEAEALREAATQEVAAVDAAIAALGDVDAAYARALQAKQDFLAQQGDAVGQRLVQIAERRGEVLAREQQVGEAQAAARHAAELLEEARRLLDNARSWSTWDVFGGGGMLTDAMKYDQLDQAGDRLRDVDVALGRLSRELGDVGMAGVGGLGLDTSTRTFDVFFDNVFSDMAVRSRITDALERARAMATVVGGIRHHLDEERHAVGTELMRLAAERERLLTADVAR